MADILAVVVNAADPTPTVHALDRTRPGSTVCGLEVAGPAAQSWEEAANPCDNCGRALERATVDGDAHRPSPP